MELARFPSHGGLSVRGIFSYVLAALTTVLLWIILSVTPVNAQEAPDTNTNNGATWNGASLQYEGKQFISMGEAKANESHGLAEGSPYYVAIETTSAPNVTPAVQKAHVIYFAPGADPPSEGNATYVTYDYNQNTRTYSNPSGTRAITVDESSASTTATACAVESVGWIVCPVANFLAWGMDSIFYALSGFMEVQPVQVNNTQGGLYIAWNIMRAVANIAFIIAFLIIIYAQITSVAVSNYGIKRLLPRLVIAAIGVNISFLICAAAIDISNILGFSLQSLFMNMRDELLATGAPTGGEAMGSWESVTGFVLSGGTAALAGVVGAGALVAASGGTVLGAIFLLLPSLVGLLLAVLVVLLILAARQALIVILVIVAPLAIVAYLLPNTEKWFDKWRGLFLTLLIFFPAFAVVFGGAQLAGAVIIQNASSINMLILGMIVQVAPLVITPLLLKFSGSLIGAVARLVNDPNRGVLDRTRNWSNSHAERHRKRGISGDKLNGDPGKIGFMANPLRQSARYLDQRKRKREDRTATSEMNTQTAYENSRRYAKYDRKTGALTGGIALQKATAEANREKTHSHHAADVDKARRTQGSMIYDAALGAQAYKEKAEVSQNQTARYYNAVRSNEKLAARVGASALYNSSYDLETSKARLEASENLKTTYYDTQKATQGTRLSFASIRAQSSKEHLESAQQQLQAFFDTQRQSSTSSLNRSTLKLEADKSIAEAAKTNLANYIATERSTIGSQLHTETIRVEAAKQGQQIAETKLTRVIEEYKAGGATNAAGELLIDGQVITGQQQTLAEQMLNSTIDLAAETQGNQTAKNVQTRRIAEAFTETAADGRATGRADTLMTIAGSVDPDGKIRAQATATATLSKMQQQSLEDNKVLIQYEARLDPRGIKAVDKAREIINLASSSDPNDRAQVSQSQLEAAFEMRIDDGQTLDFEKARENRFIDQSMLDRVIERNRGAFKGKGGFHIQQDLGLSLQRYYEKFQAGDLEYYDKDDHMMKRVTDISDVEKVFQTDMQRARLNTFGAANADGLGSIKFGTFADTANNLSEFIKVLDLDPESDSEQAKADQRTLRGMHSALRNALSDSSIRASMNDREEEAEEMDRILSDIFNVDPIKRPDSSRETPGNAPPRSETASAEDYTPPSINPEEGSPSESSNEG